MLLFPELSEEEEQLLLSKEEEKELLDVELDEMKLLEDDCELADRWLASLEQRLLEESEELPVWGRQLLEEQEQLLL